MVDQTQLISALLLLILAFISWRWVKAQDDVSAKTQREKNAPSVEALVVNGKDYQEELEVPLGIFRKYAVPLKRLENDRVKKGIEIARDKLPTITLFYRKNHPTHIWCEEAVQRRNGKTISFMVLTAVFLVLGIYFGVTAFIR